MTEAETAKILALLKEYYPNDKESTSIKAKVRAWWFVLRDYDYEAAQKAVIEFASHDQSGFMPTPGRLVALINTGTMDEIEAWSLIRRAIGRADNYRSLTTRKTGAQTAFEALPEPLQRLVGCSAQLLAWGAVGPEELETVVASHFYRVFRARRETDSDLRALPSKNQKKQEIPGVAPKELTDGEVMR